MAETNVGNENPEISKEQSAHDKKVAAERKALLDQAAKEKIDVPASTHNPESIKKLIDSVLEQRAKAKKA